MTITLDVTARDKKTNTKSLRANGQVPAIVYGQGHDAVAITLDAKNFEKIRKEAGESTLIELKGLKGKVEVLIKEVEFNPVKHEVTHVDFYTVEQGKEMTTHVHLNFIGEAPVEDSRIGLVNKVLHEVEISCKPADLPNHIDVSLESLAGLEDKILIRDLKVGKGVTVHGHAEDPVAVVSQIKEEVEEVAAIVDMSAVEVEKKGKEEKTDSNK